MKHYYQLLFALSILNFAACANLPANVSNPVKPGWIETSAVHNLPTPEWCYFPIDKNKYVYPVTFKGLSPEEEVRFMTIGWRASNVVYKISELMDGQVKLPAMLITSRRKRASRGLWVERIATGERAQLSYLSDTVACNRKGIAIVKYTNMWISAKSE